MHWIPQLEYGIWGFKWVFPLYTVCPQYRRSESGLQRDADCWRHIARGLNQFIPQQVVLPPAMPIIWAYSRLTELWRPSQLLGKTPFLK